jgi:hypothetical protein
LPAGAVEPPAASEGHSIKRPRGALFFYGLPGSAILATSIKQVQGKGGRRPMRNRVQHIKSSFCCFLVLIAPGANVASAKDEAKKIQDSFFLIEEAYNQEPGIRDR